MKSNPNFLTSSSQGWYLGVRKGPKSIATYACPLARLESDLGEIHVLGHSAPMLQPIGVKPFLSSPHWVCGHFGTLEPKKLIIFSHVRVFLVIFRKMGGFRVGGPGGKFFGKKNFFFAWNQLTTCICCYPKSFRKNADDLNFAISVPFLMECTHS